MTHRKEYLQFAFEMIRLKILHSNDKRLFGRDRFNVAHIEIVDAF